VCKKVHAKKNTISAIDKLKYSIVEGVCAVCFAAIQETVTPNEVFECKVCGKKHILKTEFEDTPCPEHVSIGVTCVCCGKVKHTVYGHNADEKQGLCVDCSVNRTSQWKYCNSCCSFHATADMVGRLCKECAAIRFHCSFCQSTRDKRTAIELDGELICASCKEKCKCQKCSTHTIHSEGGYCYPCCDKHKIIRVNNYSFQPRFKMFGNGIHLGVENEIANVNEAAKKILASVPRSWMFMKSDSSVEYGVECVFHPTTLAYFQEHKHLIDASFKDPSLKPHKSAGMHVHMSKDKFGTYQLFKFIQFFKDHTDFIDKIAGRKNNSFAKHLTEKPVDLTKLAKQNAGEDAERYRSINIRNAATIEIRIFAGVTDTATFMKNIEFCDALYNFTKTSPHFKKGKTQLSYFISYVDKHKHIYPNLNVFLGGAPPKEVPEKYKKNDVMESLVIAATQETTLELFEGCRVVLTSNEFSADPYNPRNDSPYACEGTLTHHSDNYYGCIVLWDNGNTNSYSLSHLTAIR
jgi:hypothetical protein